MEKISETVGTSGNYHEPISSCLFGEKIEPVKRNDIQRPLEWCIMWVLRDYD